MDLDLKEYKKLDVLSRENMDCLKGIFAVCVLIHHLFQYSGLFRRTILGSILQLLGSWSVAIFFFFSGYGLLVSYKKSGENYIKKFFKNKIIPFYTIICLLIVIYLVENIILGKVVTTLQIIKSFSFGGTIIGNGWYLQVQLLLYVLFYIITYYIKFKDKTVSIYIYIYTYMDNSIKFIF